MASFDILSKVDAQALDNAIIVTKKKSPTVLILKIQS